MNIHRLLFAITVVLLPYQHAAAHDSHDHDHPKPLPKPTWTPTVAPTPTPPDYRPIRSRCIVNTNGLTNVLRASARSVVEAGGYNDIRISVSIRLARSPVKILDEGDITGIEDISLGSGKEPLSLSVEVDGPIGAPCTLEGSIYFFVSAAKNGERRRVLTTINGLEFTGSYR